MTSAPFKLTQCTDDVAMALLSASAKPGQISELVTGSVPTSIRDGMRGLAKFYVSSSVEPSQLAKDLQMYGEFAVMREAGGDAISYRYIYAVSGSGESRTVHFGAMFKRFDEHHLEQRKFDPLLIFVKRHPNKP